LDANLILFYQFATLSNLLLIKYSNISYFYIKIKYYGTNQYKTIYD